METSQNCLESFAVVFDDADNARQRGWFPRVEIVEQPIR
jgi:hypothetical protein